MLISGISAFCLFLSLGAFAFSFFVRATTSENTLVIITAAILFLAVVFHILAVIIDRRENDDSDLGKPEIVLITIKEDPLFFLMSYGTSMILGALSVAITIWIIGKINWHAPAILGGIYVLMLFMLAQHCVGRSMID